MYFNHVDVPDLNLKQVTEESGKRFYLTPEGNKYPSVTTMLSHFSSNQFLKIHIYSNQLKFERKVGCLRSFKFELIGVYMNLQELIVAVQNGLKFAPMSETDRQGFAGAPVDALIASSDLAVYILSENKLSVITDDYETIFSLNVDAEMEILF